MKPLSILVLLAATACAPAASRSEGLSSRAVITRAEVEASEAANVYDLVRNVRPEWLRTRGIHTQGQAMGEETIVIYMDNARLGEPETMRTVTLGPVQYIRFFTPAEATQRWGAGHLLGAILISTQER